MARRLASTIQSQLLVRILFLFHHSPKAKTLYHLRAHGQLSNHTNQPPGAAVHFKRPSPTSAPTITPITFPTLPLLVVNTNQSRSTSAEVGKVRTFLASHPAIVNSILDAIDALTEAAYAFITTAASEVETGAMDKKTLVQELGALFRTNHCLLASLGVSHPKLERVRGLIDDAGVGFTKLTGGGGGGCAISLISEFSEKLEETLKEESFEVHETLLGAKGVGIWNGEMPSPQKFLVIDLEAEAGAWEWRYW